MAQALPAQDRDCVNCGRPIPSYRSGSRYCREACRHKMGRNNAVGISGTLRELQVFRSRGPVRPVAYEDQPPLLPLMRDVLPIECMRHQVPEPAHALGQTAQGRVMYECSACGARMFNVR